MCRQKKILFIASEVHPFLPESDRSLFIQNLLRKVSENGMEVRTFMPKFGIINERRYQLHEVVRFSGTNLMIDSDDHLLFIKVASLPFSRLQVYFIDNEEFFNRKYIFHNEKGEEFFDNDERSVFFVRGVIETIKKLRWIPDIIHCHGWMTALVPFLVKKHYSKESCFENACLVYSIYNDALERPFSDLLVQKFRSWISPADIENVKYFDYPINYNALTKLAIDFSDGIFVQTDHPLSQFIKVSVSNKKKVLFLPPVLSSTTASIVDSVYDFYNQLLFSSEKKSKMKTIN